MAVGSHRPFSLYSVWEDMRAVSSMQSSLDELYRLFQSQPGHEPLQACNEDLCVTGYLPRNAETDCSDCSCTWAHTLGLQPPHDSCCTPNCQLVTTSNRQGLLAL